MVTKIKNYPFIGLGILLGLVSFSIYFATLGFGFVSYDDPVYLLSNEGVINFDLNKIFSPLAQAFSPFTFLSYAIEYQLVKFHPFLYHLTNLILHIFNSIFAAYFAFKISKKNFSMAATVGLLFAAHPLHVESVAWVTERKDVLSIFFYLLALIFYIRYIEESRKRIYLISFLFFIYSVLSKSTSISLPMLLILCDYFYRRPFSKAVLIEKLPFFAVSIVITLYQMQLLETKIVSATKGLGGIGDALNSYAFYILKSFIPMGLSVYYERNAVAISHYEYMVVICILLLAIFLYWKSPEIRREAVFGFGFFVLSVLPVSQIIPFGTGFIYADRYMYLPSVGLFFAIAIIALRLVPKRLFLIALGVVVSALGFTSYERTLVWGSSMALWQDALSKYPESSVASNNLGIEVFQTQDLKSAVSHFRKAASVNPLYLEAHNNLGAALTTARDFEGAYQAFKAALKLKPDDAGAHYGIGNLYTIAGRTSDAKSEYLIAINSEPNHISARFNLGLTYMQEGLSENAINEFKRVLSLDPNHEKAKKALNSL